MNEIIDKAIDKAKDAILPGSSSNKKEEKTEEKKEVAKASPEDASLQKLKAEVADLYIRKVLNKKKGGFVALGAALGVNLSPSAKRAKEYILADDEEEEVDGDDDENPMNSATKNIEKKVKEAQITAQTALLEHIPEGESLSYDKETELDPMKELLKKTNTTAELQTLKKQVKKGKDPTKDPTTPDTTAAQTTETKPATKPDSLPSSTNEKALGALLGGSLVVISQVDLDALKTEKESIKPEITWDFASVKQVKNKEGKVILEGVGKTPYIHKEVWDDLETLALLFYAKTGKALSLTSAYRTHTQQEALKKEKPSLAATPGHSGHETGRSIDVNANDNHDLAIGGLPGFIELAKKCHFNPLKGEDWHFDHETLPKDSDRPNIALALDTEFHEKLTA